MECSEFLVIEPEKETLGTPEDREIYDTKTGYVFSEKDVYTSLGQKTPKSLASRDECLL